MSIFFILIFRLDTPAEKEAQMISRNFLDDERVAGRVKKVLKFFHQFQLTQKVIDPEVYEVIYQYALFHTHSNINDMLIYVFLNSHVWFLIIIFSIHPNVSQMTVLMT